MYKLSVKFSKLLIGAFLVSVAAIILLPPQPFCPAIACTLHYSIHILIILAVGLIAPLSLFDRASRLQKYQIGVTIIALSCFYGALGNLFYNPWHFQPGDMLDFSVAQVLIMNLGAVITALGLYKLEPFDSFSAGGLERLQKAKAHDLEEQQKEAVAAEPGFETASSAADFMKAGPAKGFRRLGSSKTDMQAIQPQAPKPAVTPQKPPAKEMTSVESAQALMMPSVEIDLDAADEMLSTPLNPSSAPAKPAAGAPAGAGVGAGPAADKGAKGAATTGNRMQAQRRRNTSTFTKLQALSASGTGSVAKPVEKEAGASAGGDLRSLLDRLDTEEPAHEPIESLAPLEEVHPIPPPEEIRIDVLFADLDVAKKAAAPPRPAAPPPRPTPAPAQSKTPPPAPTNTPPPVARESAPTPAQPSRPPASGTAKTPTPSAPSKPAPVAQGGGGTPRLASLLDRAEAMSEPEPVEESKEEEPVVQKTAERPKEPEPVEEKEAPAEAVAEAGSGLLSRRFMELSEEEEEAAPSAVQQEITEEEPHAPAEPTEQEEKLFSAEVDSEIDDIFSNLAPAEAQREVVHERGARPMESLAKPNAQEEEEEAEPVAAKKEVREELEPEEKVEVPEVPQQSDQLPETAEEEVPAEEAPESKGEEGEREHLFGESVDEEIDDIFGSLAPAEAQRTVEDIHKKRKEEKEEEPLEPSREDTGELRIPVVKKEGKLAQPTQAAAKHVPEEIKEVEEPQEEETPLFKLGDSDVDDIFAGITTEKQMEVSPESLARIKSGEKAEAPAASTEETGEHPAMKPETVPKSATQTGEMPAITPEQAAKLKAQVDKSIEGMIEEDEEEIETEPEAPPESPEAAKLKKELKEFGKLSVKSAATPKPSGDNVGTMKTIGKLLIDTQAVENIIKAGEQRKLGAGLSTARIISTQRGQGITELLNKIDQYEGVTGSLIVGHDGLVMASTLKQGWDKDMMGALSTALLSTSNLTTKKLEIGKLRQMVMLTKINGAEKTTVLTDVDVGILAVFVEETQIDKIDGLLDIIHKTIHG